MDLIKLLNCCTIIHVTVEVNQSKFYVLITPQRRKYVSDYPKSYAITELSYKNHYLLKQGLTDLKYESHGYNGETRLSKETKQP